MPTCRTKTHSRSMIHATLSTRGDERRAKNWWKRRRPGGETAATPKLPVWSDSYHYKWCHVRESTLLAEKNCINCVWEISADSLLKRRSILSHFEDAYDDGKHLLFLTHRGKAAILFLSEFFFFASLCKTNLLMNRFNYYLERTVYIFITVIKCILSDI